MSDRLSIGKFKLRLNFELIMQRMNSLHLKRVMKAYGDKMDIIKFIITSSDII